MIKNLVNKIVLQKGHTLKLCFAASLLYTAGFWTPTGNNIKLKIIKWIIGISNKNQWIIDWPLSYLITTLIFVLLLPVATGMSHLLFYIAGQKKNRSWAITFRFLLFCGIILSVPSLFGNITNIIYYGNDFFDLIINHSEENGLLVTYGLIVNFILSIPFFAIGFYTLIWGGAFLSGARWWKMLIAFLILSIGFLIILGLAIALTQSFYD